MDVKTFSSHDEMMAYFQEKLHKLKVRKMLTFNPREQERIGAEIERYRRMISDLRKTGARIQYAVDMGARSTEVLKYDED